MQHDSILSKYFKCTRLLTRRFSFHRKPFSVLVLQWQQQQWHLFWQQIRLLQQPQLVSIHNAIVGELCVFCWVFCCFSSLKVGPDYF